MQGERPEVIVGLRGHTDGGGSALASAHTVENEVVSTASPVRPTVETRNPGAASIGAADAK